MGKPLIIVGPQASGKTKNASAFLRAFGCIRLVDDWHGQSALTDGDLALTNIELSPVPPGYRLMSVEAALKRIGCA